jgi:hypothetical protein
VFRLPLAGLTGVVLAAFALSGCDTVLYSALNRQAGGAKLAVDRTVVADGGTLTLDITGSSFDGESTCPQSAYFFLDDELGEDDTIRNLETLEQGGTCRVVDGQVEEQLKLAPGEGAAGPVERKLQVSLVGTTDDGKLVQSDATTTVRIVRAGAPASGAPAPIATTPAVTPPAGEPPLGPIATSCGTAPVEPSGFSWRFHLNPGKPRAGSPIEWDVRPTTSGTPIVRYDWDTDGDGKSDVQSRTPVLRFTPAGEGTRSMCLQATDAAGRVATHPYSLTVGPATGVGAEAFTITPERPRPGQAVTFTPPATPPAVGFLCLYFGADQDGNGFEDYDCKPPGQTFTYTYATADLYEPRMQFIDTTTSETNAWYGYVPVSPTAAARRGAAPVASAAATRRGKAVSLVTPLTGTSRVRSAGRLRLDGAILRIDGAVVTGRLRSKLPAATRRKVPAKLRFLLDAEYAATVSGQRTMLSPDLFGLAGTGRILAQARGDRRTKVCMTMTSDGRSQAGTRWKVVGATGRAAGSTGSGLATALVLGKGADALPHAATVTLKPGPRRGIGACRALVRHLPKAPGRKRKK